ncbi:MAG: hypothetical protein E3J70_00905 [Candidatus Heimdallarchaeota archaeon]|nr:MAG: hypothetical protein E3J70_00905 [Candidatus Heimdallarchaeota archaeon]
MKYVCFDTNYLLAVLIPLDNWKPIIEMCEAEISELVSNKIIKVYITDKVEEEAKNRIKDIAKNASQHLRKLFQSLKSTDLKKSFNKSSILKLRKELQLILRDEKDKVIRNQLYFYEDYLLKNINDYPEKTKKILIGECLSEINEITMRFDTELQVYNILIITKPTEQKEIEKLDKIEDRIKAMVHNYNDSEILATFIHFINEENTEGLFVTHDFVDLLLNSLYLEEEFKEIHIIRPQYVKFLV